MRRLAYDMVLKSWLIFYQTFHSFLKSEDNHMIMQGADQTTAALADIVHEQS